MGIKENILNVTTSTITKFCINLNICTLKNCHNFIFIINILGICIGKFSITTFVPL